MASPVQGAHDAALRWGRSRGLPVHVLGVSLEPEPVYVPPGGSPRAGPDKESC